MPELSDFDLFLQQLDENKQRDDIISDHFPIQQPLQTPSLDSLLSYSHLNLPHPPTLDSRNWIPEQHQQYQSQSQSQSQSQQSQSQPQPQPQPQSQPQQQNHLNNHPYFPEIKIEDADENVLNGINDSTNLLIPLPQQSTQQLSPLIPTESSDSEHLQIKSARAKRHSRSNSQSSSRSSSNLHLPLSPSLSNSPLLSPNSDSCLSFDESSDDEGSTSTYICQTCGKEFNRPYNLKSHLRTHTDDKPFPCKVCGKTFARQHDCKRHEDLHTGERKFQCRGTTSNSNIQWGCLKKFARTDALRRHFWTENGKNCIKPLLNDYNKDLSNDHEAAVQLAMQNALDLMKTLNPSLRKPRERKSRK